MKHAARKNVVKFKPTVKQPALKVELKGWWYAGCPQCGLRMTTSSDDRICQDCSTLGPYGRPLWDRESDPKTCCLMHSAPITDVQVLQNYRCGGGTAWWLCSGCSRTHPYDPKHPPTREDAP
ncbi:MAG: hypothetical protein ACLGIS_10960 [Actinomycetes bacterium]